MKEEKRFGYFFFSFSKIRDLKVYMLMLTIFIFGFGVSLYSLIHGVQPFSFHLPREIMNLAYWEMFGDLNELDTFEREKTKLF